MPNALESNFKPRRGKFYRAAARVDFENSEAKFIVGRQVMFVARQLIFDTGWPFLASDNSKGRASYYRPNSVVR